MTFARRHVQARPLNPHFLASRVFLIWFVLGSGGLRRSPGGARRALGDLPGDSGAPGAGPPPKKTTGPYKRPSNGAAPKGVRKQNQGNRRRRRSKRPLPSSEPIRKGRRLRPPTFWMSFFWKGGRLRPPTFLVVGDNINGIVDFRSRNDPVPPESHSEKGVRLRPQLF